MIVARVCSARTCLAIAVRPSPTSRCSRTPRRKTGYAVCFLLLVHDSRPFRGAHHALENRAPFLRSHDLQGSVALVRRLDPGGQVQFGELVEGRAEGHGYQAAAGARSHDRRLAGGLQEQHARYVIKWVIEENGMTGINSQ